MKFHWSGLAFNKARPFLLVCLVGILLYGHTLHAPFYLDDSGAIYDSGIVKDLGRAVSGIFTMRGLSTLTFAINYQLDELNVVGYHLVNIAIHLGTSCLVLLLLRRIFPLQPRLQLFGALLFVAHPIQTQAVTYLVQRMTSLSALLFLLALFLFARAREALDSGAEFRDRRHLFFYVAALLSGGLAVLAKENAVVLPVALFLFGYFFLPARKGGWRARALYISPFLIVPAIAIGVYLLVPIFTAPKFDTMGHSRFLRSMEGNSPLHYLATQCSVLWIYIRMLFLPYGQALDHAYPVSRELLTVKSVTGFFGLSGLFALVWHLRCRQPIIAFAILWFFLTLAVESSIIPLDPLFEHRLYLPMFGMAALVPALFNLMPRPQWQLGVGIVVILVLAVLTWRRNDLWNDPLAFYADNLRISPENERVYFNLGQECLKVGIVDEGERLVRESIALNPSRYFGYISLKELYVAQDRLDEAIAMLHYGLDHVSPGDKGRLYNELAFIHGKRGDFSAAIEMLQRSIDADPKIAASYYNLAQMLMFAGEKELIELNLRKTLEIEPDHADARGMLENMMFRANAPPEVVPPAGEVGH